MEKLSRSTGYESVAMEILFRTSNRKTFSILELRTSLSKSLIRKGLCGRTFYITLLKESNNEWS